MEPCGCRKDMLGGLDHAAALLDATYAEAPDRLVLAAGPLLFLNPELEEGRNEQDLWKAESIAASLADVHLDGWAPGVNDFAAGSTTLERLAKSSGAKMLAANLKTNKSSLVAVSTFRVGKYRVGVAGIGAAPSRLLASGEITTSNTQQALASAVAQLKAQGADILVALIAAKRGDALRLAEQVPDFSVIALGNPENHGEDNDAESPPILIGDTLVVQSPNHLQALAYIDLFVKDGKLKFADGIGIARAERIQSLERRITATSLRLKTWQQATSPSAAEVKSRQQDLAQLRKTLATLTAKKHATPSTSFFRYRVETVRESAGTNEQVVARMTRYYRKVNDHNKIAFKDRKPKPVKSGQAHYAGQQECADCHGEAEEFWRTTKHSSAYATLADDFKEFNLDCVACHVTGYEKPGGSTVTFVENLKNVQCEACHGAGSLHADDSDLPGLITLKPDQSVCRGCHHTPHVADDWDIDHAWEQIIGPGHGG